MHTHAANLEFEQAAEIRDYLQIYRNREVALFLLDLLLYFDYLQICRHRRYFCYNREYKIIIMKQPTIRIENQLGSPFWQLMLPAFMVALFLLLVGLAPPLAAQAEDAGTVLTQAEETLGPGTSNGHEVDNLADPTDANNTETGEIGVDPEVGGVRLSLILFIVGGGTILVFVVIFLQKFILRKP